MRLDVRWLPNHGVRIASHVRGGVATRYEPPNGWLSVEEAARAVRVNTMRIYRWIRAGKLRRRRRERRSVVSLTDLRLMRGNARDRAVA